jgi:hypothetical protein
MPRPKQVVPPSGQALVEAVLLQLHAAGGTLTRQPLRESISGRPRAADFDEAVGVLVARGEVVEERVELPRVTLGGWTVLDRATRYALTKQGIQAAERVVRRATGRKGAKRRG